jgi:hypothetical protein
MYTPIVWGSRILAHMLASICLHGLGAALDVRLDFSGCMLQASLVSLIISTVYKRSGCILQDIFTLFHLGKDFKFVSKTSIFLIPIVGWSMWLTGELPFVI